jgi:predicted HTH transcriptional regulator
MKEDNKIEYKIEIPKKTKDLKAEIVSFLNSDGGTILLGVDDNGKLLDEKVKYYKEWEEILSNWINNAFEPNVNHLIGIYPNERPFRIEVKSGKNKPYFYKDG